MGRERTGRVAVAIQHQRSRARSFASPTALVRHRRLREALDASLEVQKKPATARPSRSASTSTGTCRVSKASASVGQDGRWGGRKETRSSRRRGWAIATHLPVSALDLSLLVSRDPLRPPHLVHPRPPLQNLPRSLAILLLFFISSHLRWSVSAVLRSIGAYNCVSAATPCSSRCGCSIVPSRSP
ncbi:hypothetical protein VTN02DRAFT_2577 [Thermoascus thermophilus]